MSNKHHVAISGSNLNHDVLSFFFKLYEDFLFNVH